MKFNSVICFSKS